MSEKKFFALLGNLWKDIHFVEFYGLLAALVAIFALSWWLASQLRQRQGAQVASAHVSSSLRDFGTGSVKRIAFPLITLTLVSILRYVLERLEVAHLALLSVVSLLLASWVLVRTAVYILRGVFPHGSFLKSFERVISLVIWGGMLAEMTGLSDDVIEWLQRFSFGVGHHKFDLWMLLRGSVTVCVTLLVALWIASLVERRLMLVSEIDGNVRVVLARLAKALLSVIAVLFSLSLLGIDVTTLSVFSGALAVGLGMGLQRIASNYVSGFIILLDRSIRIGNLIALDDNTTGTITRITTRYTVLRTLSGTEIIIPNEYLVSNTVRNLSFSDKAVRVATSVGVAYDTDVERAIPLLIAIAQAHPRVLADPAPGVLLTEFADSCLTLELGFWISDPELGMGGVRSEVNLEILRTFRREGISIPFPQREVRILSTVENAEAAPAPVQSA